MSLREHRRALTRARSRNSSPYLPMSLLGPLGDLQMAFQLAALAQCILRLQTSGIVRGNVLEVRAYTSQATRLVD